jgi:signal transduction histidine kinase
VDAGEVLRQASAVIGRPVTLWEVTGEHEAVPRATSDQSSTSGFDLETTLRRWNIPIPIGSRWVAAPGQRANGWVIAPVRSRPPAPPPQGRERRSKERLALELTGLALGLIDAPQDAGSLPPGMLAHEASNPLAAARAGLQLAMESVGRWVDLAADRRLALLDDLGQVLEDLDRTTEFLRAVRERARTGSTARVPAERFDAVRVIRSCLTLERRLLRDRGIDLDFTTSLEASYLTGDPNALFDVLVNLVRNAAESSGSPARAIRVQLDQRGRDLELTVQGGGSATAMTKLREVTETVFSGTLKTEADQSPTGGAGATTYTIVLPLPAQRGTDNRRG